ncbi:hypothetical protein [Streptomyces sp. NPDC060205]|uniref:hypothetical protein n=1 Tax=Streptomyces sp. NPDC060205 TaxID=3347072 RepID=UPI0036599EA0
MSVHDTPQAPYIPQVPSLRQHPADFPRRESSAPTSLDTRLVEPFDDGPLVLTGLSYGGRRRAKNGFRVEPLDCDHWEVLESGTSPLGAAVLGAELAALSDAPAAASAAAPVAAPVVTEEA